MNKVHFIGASGRTSWAYTACGMQGMYAFAGEYDTVNGDRFEARFKDWHGVTCKRCLRNPHAPGNRFAVAKAETSTE